MKKDKYCCACTDCAHDARTGHLCASLPETDNGGNTGKPRRPDPWTQKVFDTIAHAMDRDGAQFCGVEDKYRSANIYGHPFKMWLEPADPGRWIIKICRTD